MLRAEWTITIPGHPAPKGSLKCIGRRGTRAHVLVEDNADTTPWRVEVKRAWANTTARAERNQPIGAEVTFTLERPKHHYGTGRNAGKVKASAPAHPVSHSTGDVDKLLRLILDALQDAEVLPDDAQVIEVTTRKAFTVAGAKEADAWDRLPWPGVRIRLYPYDTPP